jgi:FkbM family methyltransferase
VPLNPAFRAVSVAGRPAVEFCIDPAASDPVGAWLQTHDTIDEPVMRLFLQLVAPGARVVDLGAHLGTFSLPAAGHGAEVLAVDASPQHVRLLQLAAERNGFKSLQAVNAAIAHDSGHVRFIEQSIHSTIWQPEDGKITTISVPTATVDGLLDRRGWDTVDVIKMDIEGAEAAALRGMRRLLARRQRPAIVFECNGTMLPRQASSTHALKQTIAALGYELLLIDHLRPGRLVEQNQESVQTECVCDYLAVAERPPDLERSWIIEPPFCREQTVKRLLDVAFGPHAPYRDYAIRTMAHGPAWLRDWPPHS